MSTTQQNVLQGFLNRTMHLDIERHFGDISEEAWEIERDALLTAIQLLCQGGV